MNVDHYLKYNAKITPTLQSLIYKYRNEKHFLHNLEKKKKNRKKKKQTKT